MLGRSTGRTFVWLVGYLGKYKLVKLLNTIQLGYTPDYSVECNMGIEGQSEDSMQLATFDKAVTSLEFLFPLNRCSGCSGSLVMQTGVCGSVPDSSDSPRRLLGHSCLFFGVTQKCPALQNLRGSPENRRVSHERSQ